MTRTCRDPGCRASPRVTQGCEGSWLPLLLQGVFLLAALLPTPDAFAVDALILGRDVHIRETPQVAAKVIKTAQPGETYEVTGRKPGKGQPLYIFDERGNLWVKVRVGDDMQGFVRTNLVSVAREEYPSPRGEALLIVNLRPTIDGAIQRELWVVQNDWHLTRRLALIEGKPVWASNGEWFICQADSERPIKDPNVERTVEEVEKFSADGRTRTLLAIGSDPVLYEARGEVYFYRDVGEQGEAVPPGLFAVNVDGSNLRPVFLLPERFRFWKEDGDFYVQAPPPLIHIATGRISLRAFDPRGTKIRFTVTMDGQLVEQRPD
jgi:hypothetical protein